MEPLLLCTNERSEYLMQLSVNVFHLNEEIDQDLFIALGRFNYKALTSLKTVQLVQIEVLDYI